MKNHPVDYTIRRMIFFGKGELSQERDRSKPCAKHSVVIQEFKTLRWSKQNVNTYEILLGSKNLKSILISHEVNKIFMTK